MGVSQQAAHLIIAAMLADQRPQLRHIQRRPVEAGCLRARWVERMCWVSGGAMLGSPACSGARKDSREGKEQHFLAHQTCTAALGLLAAAMPATPGLTW